MEEDMSAIQRLRLRPDEAIKHCNTSEVAPMSSGETVDPKLFLGLGQERFLQAINLCVKTDAPHHNMHLTDLSGPGSFEIIEGYLKRELGERAVAEPQDVVYVYNFEEAQCPVPIMFQKGRGKKFKQLILRLLTELKKVVPDAFRSGRIQSEMRPAVEALEAWQKNMNAHARPLAQEHGFFLNNSDERAHSLSLRPLVWLLRTIMCNPDAFSGRDGNEPVTSEELDELTDEQREMLGERGRMFSSALDAWRLEQGLIAEFSSRMEELNNLQESVERRVASEAIEKAFNKWFPDTGAGTKEFRKQLLEYAVGRYKIFLKGEGGPAGMPPWMQPVVENQNDDFLPWEVKVFVDNSQTEGVPIVSCGVTSLSKAIGSIGRGRAYGPYMVAVDHRNLTAGLFHVANGGYLVLSARDVATVPGLWQVLKYVVKNQEIPVGELSILAPMYETLHPEPIPANIKVVLFGPAWLMRIFRQVDDEFTRLFTIHGELLVKVRRTPEQVRAYSSWFRACALQNGLHSLSDDGVCALVEYAGRLSGENDYLSIDFETLATVVGEASASIDENLPESEKQIGRSHIEEAVRNSVWRAGVSHQRFLENVGNGNILISTLGSAVGQINGLAVSHYEDANAGEVEGFCRTAVPPFALPVDDARAVEREHLARGGASRVGHYFGHATRITAQASVGKFMVVNIPKEVKMTGPTFEKADLTVQGLLRGLYGKSNTLSAHITYTFEQMYGGIDGDSASLAKFYAITSAVSGIPIRQSIAITGSVNQHGDVQPIGGVNEKIEGFFDTCLTQGELTGEQGVIIPHQNAKHLMLRQDIVQAIADKKFNVWAIPTLDDGIDIITGVSPRAYHAAVRRGFRELARKGARKARAAGSQKKLVKNTKKK